MSIIPNPLRILSAHGFVCGLIMLVGSRVALGQGLSDLVGNNKSTQGQELISPDAQLRFGRDRVDLSLSPGLGALASPQKKFVGFSAQADLRMICG